MRLFYDINITCLIGIPHNMPLKCRLLPDRCKEIIAPSELRPGDCRPPSPGGRPGMTLQPLQFVTTRPRSSISKRTSLSRRQGPLLRGVMAVVGRSAMSKELMSTYKHTKRVGPYLLGPTIGEGSFAKVKEAMHILVGEKVAIKIIDKKAARDDAYLHKTLRREAGLLQLLCHAHIVRLLEVMETDNNLYLVLELCGGGPLLERVCAKGGVEEGVARRYIKQVVAAVHHMHQMGVVHRDLKVENLLLDDNDKIKIIDFGLSNFIGNLERETNLRDAKKREREISSHKQTDVRATRRQSCAVGGRNGVSDHKDSGRGDGGGAGERKQGETKGVVRGRLPSDDGTSKRRTRGASFRDESSQQTWRERAGSFQRKNSNKEKGNANNKPSVKQIGSRVPGCGDGVITVQLGNIIGKRAKGDNSPDRRREVLRNRVRDVFGTRDFAGTLCGSPAYAAPEIIARKRYGPKVDVWSIGVNAYAILTGTLPFIVEPFNLRQLLSKIQKGEMGPLPSGLSSDCKSFIRYLLEPDPEKRPTIYDVMCHPWLAGVYESPHSASPTGATHPLTPTPPTTPRSARRVSRMLLDHDIVGYIRETLGIKSTHVSESVLAGRADEYSAIYHLLAKQRERDEVPKIARRLQDNWDTFRACSRQENDDEEIDLDNNIDDQNVTRQRGGATVNRDGLTKRTTDDDNDDDDEKKTIAEQTAIQIAGKKNGSFHFKMAMVIEEEAERVAKSPTNVSLGVSPTKSRETSAIYREVLGGVHPESSSVSPTKSTSSKDGRTGTPFSQPQRNGNCNLSCPDGSRVSAASGNPWIIMLGRERTTSTVRTSLSGRDTKTENKLYQSGVTTACFQQKVKKKDVKIPPRSDSYQGTRRDFMSNAEKHERVTERASISRGRAVNLTFQQSTDPTVTTFTNHFRQSNKLPDRLTRRSNLKTPFITGRNVGGQGRRLDQPKAVTFRRNRNSLQAETKLRGGATDRTVANTIGVQSQKSAKAAENNDIDNNKEVAMKVYRSTRNTSTVPREFAVIQRQRRPVNQVKRKPVGKPPVTLSCKPSKTVKGKTNQQKEERLSFRTTAKMSGRPSTASLQDVQHSIEQAAVKVSGTCSRTKGKRIVNSSVNDQGELSDIPRRFSTSDEGYDTTHSIDGDSIKKLPDIAPPIVRLSPQRLSDAEHRSVSATMRSLKLENTT